MPEHFPSPKAKVFVIGHNKTGTTSMEALLGSLDYRLGDQVAGELLLDDWADGRFDRIVDLCRTADAFQDIPFSLWGTYRILDLEFPGSKFVLTVRDSATQWYESVCRWGRKLVNAQGPLPTAEEMGAFAYRAPGWFLRSHLLIYGVGEDELYQRDRYIRAYEDHIAAVEEYFAGRPGALLVLNLADPASLGRLCHFLGVAPPPGMTMPHLNQNQTSAAQERVDAPVSEAPSVLDTSPRRRRNLLRR